MAEIGYASLGIIPSFDGFQGKLEGGTAKAMTAAGISGGQTFGDEAGKSAGKRFTSRVKTFAKIGAATLAGAAAIGFKFAGDAIGEARESQKVGALTASTIKATGKAAKVTAKQVGELSGKISAKTGIDDEAIQSGANMLLTFKNIRNEAGEGNKIFDQSLRTLTDLSAAMGTDAKSSAIQLGKALNDPVKGITALTRVGVTFTDQQKKQIEQMVKAGDVAGAQKVILRELKSEFGGAAAAQATEADKLTVAWGNFKEEIGTELLPVMDDLARFLRKKGIPAARDFIGWVRDDGIPALKHFGDKIGPIVDDAKDLARWLGKLPTEAKVAGLVSLFGAVAALKLRGGGGGALGTFGKALGLAKPIKTFETNPAALGKGGAVPIPGGGAGGGGFWKGLGAFIKGGATPAAAAVVTGYMEKWFESGFKPGKGKTGVADKAGQIIDNIQLGKAAGWSDKIGSVVPFLDTAGEAARKGVEEADKALANLVNSGNAKSAREQFKALKDEAVKQGLAIDDLKAKFPQYTSALKQVPDTHVTEFLLPNFFEQYGRILKYGKYLEDLDGKTVTTFLKSVRTNNDIGESGDPRFGGFRANGGTVERGKSYIVGERRPEVFVPNTPGRIVPEVAAGSGVSVYVGQVVAHDYNDFMSQAQMRARRAALDGRRPA